MNEEIYILKDISKKMDDYAKDQTIFRTETKSGIERIQNDLKLQEKQIIEQNNEIERIREKMEKHERSFLIVWGSIILMSFFIIGLFSKN